jgi:regulatory protein
VPKPLKKKFEPSLRARALQCLARREHSRVELSAKLLPHVQEGEDLDALLDDLVKSNWLSDERTSEQIVRHRRSSCGTQRIAHELRHKGIPEELIAAALPELKDSELLTAREVWQRKFGVLPINDKEKARQIRFLQSRGFGFEVIFQVLRGVSELE